MKKIRYALSIVFVLLLLACKSPYDFISESDGQSQGDGQGSGSLTVTIMSVGVKTLIPGIDMNPAVYVVSGVGPSGATFSVNAVDTAVTVTELSFGDWFVTVDAKNIDDIVIGRGSTATTLHTGENQALTIPITPLDGYGTLDLNVLWNVGDVDIPSVESELVLSSGTTMNLDFTIAVDGNASYTGNTIPTGYHSVVVKLLDNGIAVMGALEIVRIIKDQTTSGTFEFYEINQPGGIIEVNITPALQEPIDVSITGQTDTLILGELMTLTASVPPEVGSVVYAWYLNGDSVATGSTYTVGSGLSVGAYRIDVAAFTTDGERAGSATHAFAVEEGAQVSLIWDANDEPDLAGYRLYYGLSSGNYSSSVDVGNQTTYIITGLDPAATYYIAAIAYNLTGTESDYSNEVIFYGSS